ncbi:MAG: PsiF family protein [Moraxellaceae bacterium]
MKITLAVVILLLGNGLAYGKEGNNQREDCSQRADGTSGNERTRIISACIKHNSNINVMPPTLQRMTDCNRKAGEMTGDSRVKFVDACMQES